MDGHLRPTLLGRLRRVDLKTKTGSLASKKTKDLVHSTATTGDAYRECVWRVNITSRKCCNMSRIRCCRLSSCFHWTMIDDSVSMADERVCCNRRTFHLHYKH